MSPVVVTLTAPRQVSLVEEPSRSLARHEVRIRTLLSGISAGTEMAAYRGTTPFLDKRWDPATHLFVAGGEPSLTYPLSTWGYEEVGKVVEVGAEVTDVPLGALIYGTWGHRAEHIALAEFTRDRQLPPDVETLVGIFSHVGPIALNGVLDTQVRVGETVAVFGLGVVGQLVAQLLRCSGARVIGVDPLVERRSLAARLGAVAVLDPTAGDAAQEIRQLTDGRGADACVEASGSTRALHSAIRACAYASRVVALGFYQGEGSGLFLGEEFHHNRVTVVASQIGGLNPELQHRWNRRRLIDTFFSLVADDGVHVAELVTHRAPVSQAAELFRLVDQQPGSVLQAVLEFSA
ncbi:MAG TPA: zinc-binding dehydrogenase [Chloroflexota bacterium]|jgi:threonine dehydrogenase-like Zn-dependent dehydrogenase|nr:zinc-binding dehydrogenase [Chloroflexota bacterium]